MIHTYVLEKIAEECKIPLQKIKDCEELSITINRVIKENPQFYLEWSANPSTCTNTIYWEFAIDWDDGLYPWIMGEEAYQKMMKENE